jgi:hypothetical protein
MMSQIQETSAYAIVALVLGISCYVNFFGLEKALLALLFAILALRDMSRNNKKGRSLAFLGIVFAALFVFVVFLYTKAIIVE